MNAVKTRMVWAVGVVLSGVIGCGGVPGTDLEGGDATAASAVSSSSPCRQELPARLEVEAGNELALALDADGVQIYTCTATGWAFTAPEAALYASNGRVAGHHYAGPTWEANDGSKVVAARVDGVTVDATAIPWLLLKATSHGGNGRMKDVSFIQRIATAGGLVPAGGCSAETIGSVARVPYTATYCFYVPED